MSNSVNINIKAALKAAGITQQELASRLHLSQSAISMLLSRGDNITLSSLKRVASALGCSVSYLLGEGSVPSYDDQTTCPFCGNSFHVSKADIDTSECYKKPLWELMEDE